MFIYLGKLLDETEDRYDYKNIVYDTVNMKIDVLEDNCTLLQVAMKLGIMKAVCCTMAGKTLLLLPYRKRYRVLEKFVIENAQKYIAQMKVIGKEIYHIDDTFFGSILPRGLFTMQGTFNETILGVQGGSVEYIFNSSGKFMECRFSQLENWEFIELVNEYSEYDEESVLCNDIHFYGDKSLYSLIKMIGSRVRTDFNIGFMKNPKDFRKLELSSAKDFYWNNVVVKFLDGSGRCLLFIDWGWYCDIVGDYSFVEIEWLSENIRKKLLERAM